MECPTIGALGRSHRAVEIFERSVCCKAADFGRHTITETTKLFPDQSHLNSPPGTSLFHESLRFFGVIAAPRPCK